MAFETPGEGVKTSVSKKPAVATSSKKPSTSKAPAKKPAPRQLQQQYTRTLQRYAEHGLKGAKNGCDLEAVVEMDFCGKHKNCKRSKRGNGGDDNTDDDDNAGGSRKRARKGKGKGKGKGEGGAW